LHKSSEFCKYKITRLMKWPTIPRIITYIWHKNAAHLLSDFHKNLYIVYPLAFTTLINHVFVSSSIPYWHAVILSTFLCGRNAYLFTWEIQKTRLHLLVRSSVIFIFIYLEELNEGFKIIFLFLSLSLSSHFTHCLHRGIVL